MCGCMQLQTTEIMSLTRHAFCWVAAAAAAPIKQFYVSSGAKLCGAQARMLVVGSSDLSQPSAAGAAQQHWLRPPVFNKEVIITTSVGQHGNTFYYKPY